MSLLTHRHFFKLILSTKVRPINYSIFFSTKFSNKKDRKFYETCFRTLDLEPDSSQDQGRTQYIRLVKRFHPDLDNSQPDNSKLGNSKLDNLKPDNSKPDNLKSNNIKPDNMKLESSKEDSSKSDNSASDKSDRLKEFIKIDEVKTI